MARTKRSCTDIIFDIQQFMEARLTYNKYFETFNLEDDISNFDGNFPPQQVNLLFNANLSNTIISLLNELDELRNVK